MRSVVSPDPALLRENRLGTVVVQGQRVWADSAVSAAWSPKLASTPSDASASLDLGSTNAHHRWLLTASHRFGAALSPQLLLYGGESTPTQVGLNVSTLLNSATVAFVEYAAGRDRSLAAQASGAPKAESWRQRAALGLTYTTAFNLSLTAEADFNGAAPNRAQWDGVRAGAAGSALRLLQAAQDSQELPVRRAAFFYATWRDAFVRRLDLSGFVRYDAVTHSRAQWLETRYHWDGADLALQWQLYSGGPDTVYGSVPQKRAAGGFRCASTSSAGQRQMPSAAARRQPDARQDQQRADAVEPFDAFAEDRPGEGGAVERAEVEHDADARRAERALHVRVGAIGACTRNQRRRENQAEALPRQLRRQPGQGLPERERDQDDDAAAGDERQARDRTEGRAPAAQQQRIGGPAQHRHRHPGVARIDLQGGERLPVSPEEDVQHPGQRQQGARAPASAVTRSRSHSAEAIAISTGAAAYSRPMLIALVLRPPM